MGLRASRLSKIFRPNGALKSLLGSSPVVPKGYIPVSVGLNDESKRFIVHRSSLQDDEFVKFLYRSAEEYGFCNQGVLRIFYNPKDFEDWVIREGRKKKIWRVRLA